MTSSCIRALGDDQGLSRPRYAMVTRSDETTGHSDAVLIPFITSSLSGHSLPPENFETKQRSIPRLKPALRKNSSVTRGQSHSPERVKFDANLEISRASLKARHSAPERVYSKPPTGVVDQAVFELVKLNSMSCHQSTQLARQHASAARQTACAVDIQLHSGSATEIGSRYLL